MGADDVSREPVRGSYRAPVPGAKPVGTPDPERRAAVTLTLRRRGPEPEPGGEPVPRAEFAERYGADPDDIALVEGFAAAHGLDVADADVARRIVRVEGPLGRLAEAFGAELVLYEDPQAGVYRGRTGEITLPAPLAGAVESVLGLDDRPAASPHFLRARPPGAAAPRAAGDGFAPGELARLYDFPTGVTGAGRTVAVIELGGGFRDEDLDAYFAAQGVKPRPRVEAVSVDGGENAPDGPDGADGEVMLDIEVIGAVAPGARIAVYFAPNTTAGFLDAITTAVHDAARAPSIVSISWGQAEDDWTAQARRSYDHAFRDAAALGVAVLCASGDDGSADRVGDGRAHVDFPAASPWVLGCGGTRVDASDGRIASEVTWNEPGHGATGGGVSRSFPLPDYQSGAGVPPQADDRRTVGRGVPDVAGNADPLTGYQVRVDGEDTVIGGTSAVAPLYAGLLALLEEALDTPVGFLHPLLYGGAATRAGALRDVTVGDNGAYAAGPGWDACTGLGSLDGTALLQALRGSATV